MLRSLLLLVWFLALNICSVQSQFVFDTPSDPDGVLDPAVVPLAGVSSPTLLDDEEELYLASVGNIWRATRSSTTLPFKDPFRNSTLSTDEYIEESPFLSPDGLRIYFTRKENNPTTKVREIFVASRPDTGSDFGDPVSLGPDGTLPFEGRLGSLTGDELTVFLEVLPNAKDKDIADQTDIAVAKRSSIGDRFGPWERVAELNTENNESSPFITRDGLSIFFSRLMPGLPGGILSANRPDSTSPFSEPALVPGLNVANSASEDPYLIFPGSRMYFVLDDDLVYSDRVLEATYILDEATAMKGRDFWIPIKMQTREKDASLFEFNLSFDPNSIVWLDAIPNERLGFGYGKAELVAQHILSVKYQAKRPLRGNGHTEEILTLRFAVKETASTVDRPYGLSAGASLNGVDITPLPTSVIHILDSPSRPFSSLWMLR